MTRKFYFIENYARLVYISKLTRKKSSTVSERKFKSVSLDIDRYTACTNNVHETFTFVSIILYRNRTAVTEINFS